MVIFNPQDAGFRKAILQGGNITPQNNPPSMSQKEHMRRTWLSAEIVLKISRVIAVRNTRYVRLSMTQIDAAMPHMAGESIRLGISVYDLTTAINVRKAMGLTWADMLQGLTWEGIPVILSNEIDSVGYGTNKDEESEQVERTFWVKNQFEAMNLLISEDVQTQCLFNIMYLSDLEQLVMFDRPRGQTLIRYLPVYASPKINERIYHNWEAVIKNIRLKMLDGLDLNELDYDTLGRIIAESRATT